MYNLYEKHVIPTPSDDRQDELLLTKPGSGGSVQESRLSSSSPLLRTKTCESSFLFLTFPSSDANTPMMYFFPQRSWGENGTPFCSMTTTRMTCWVPLVLTAATTTTTPRKLNRFHGSTMTGGCSVCTRTEAVRGRPMQ